jgi:hypothetical protein
LNVYGLSLNDTLRGAVKETQCSFKYQIQSDLINSNLDKYTFMTTSDRALRQTAVNNDIFILQKHYKNKVPNNLNSERKKFQNIINNFNKQFLKYYIILLATL